jgi:hypothetical protein
MAEDTPKKEPEATVDWEKRYKDEQAKISELANEKKALSEELSKSKQTLEAVQPYIDWDAASGTPQEDVAETDPIDKKLTKVASDVDDKIAWALFRAENPELRAHEPILLNFVQKSTGTRDERLEKAKKLTIAYIQSIRDEGKKAALEQTDETAKKEAEAGGLAPSATPPSDEKPVTKEESNNNYISARQAAAARARGFS